MLDWDTWKFFNKNKLTHIAGYEEKFVDLILSNIPEITPEDVISQYHFIDRKGNSRFIDFFILNKEKFYILPIELDGVWKSQNYEAFNDMLERQNSLIEKFGTVLRFSNKKMFEEPNEIIAEIRDILNKQSNIAITNDYKGLMEAKKNHADFDRKKSYQQQQALLSKKINEKKEIKISPYPPKKLTTKILDTVICLILVAFLTLILNVFGFIIGAGLVINAIWGEDYTSWQLASIFSKEMNSKVRILEQAIDEVDRIKNQEEK